MLTAKVQISLRIRGLIRVFAVLLQSLDTTDCINGEHRPRQDFVHAQDDLNLCMFEETFSLVAAQMSYNIVPEKKNKNKKTTTLRQ